MASAIYHLNSLGARDYQREEAKKAKIIIQAFQCVLKQAGLTSVFKLGEAVSTTEKSISIYSGTLTLTCSLKQCPTWTEDVKQATERLQKVEHMDKLLKQSEDQAEATSSTAPDDDDTSEMMEAMSMLDDLSRAKAPPADVPTLVIDLPGGILIDFENKSLYRIKREELESAVSKAKTEESAFFTRPSFLSRTAQECLGRFLPEKQPAVRVRTLLTIRQLESKECHVVPVLKESESRQDFGSKSKVSSRGVKLAVFVDREPVLLPFFIPMKAPSVGMSASFENELYARHTRDPFISPTNLYNAVLAYTFKHEVKSPKARLFIDYVQKMRKY